MPYTHAMCHYLLVCDTCDTFINTYITYFCVYTLHSCIHAMFLPLLVCDTCGKLPSRRDTSAGRDANLANFNVSARTYKSSHKDLKYQK